MTEAGFGENQKSSIFPLFIEILWQCYRSIVLFHCPGLCADSDLVSQTFRVPRIHSAQDVV